MYVCYGYADLPLMDQLHICPSIGLDPEVGNFN